MVDYNFWPKLYQMSYVDHVVAMEIRDFILLLTKSLKIYWTSFNSHLQYNGKESHICLPVLINNDAKSKQNFQFVVTQVPT